MDLSRDASMDFSSARKKDICGGSCRAMGVGLSPKLPFRGRLEEASSPARGRMLVGSWWLAVKCVRE